MHLVNWNGLHFLLPRKQISDQTRIHPAASGSTRMLSSQNHLSQLLRQQLKLKRTTKYVTVLCRLYYFLTELRQLLSTYWIKADFSSNSGCFALFTSWEEDCCVQNLQKGGEVIYGQTPALLLAYRSRHCAKNKDQTSIIHTQITQQCRFVVDSKTPLVQKYSNSFRCSFFSQRKKPRLPSIPIL